MKVDFDRQREWWDAKATGEENCFSDMAVNRALRWREIERRLDGIRTILSVGGGSGLFTIPLAKRGFEVTHLDISPEMIQLAQEKAAGVERLSFVEANAKDLSRFDNRSFDLVLNMDDAISFCGQAADRALSESCRVAEKRILFTVSNHLSQVAGWMETGLHVFGRIIPAAREMLKSGQWWQEQYPENAVIAKGCTQDYVGPLKAYRPAELRSLVEQQGFCILRCGGLGTLARLIREEELDRAMESPDVFKELLDDCETIDREYPDGPGTRQRAGLIVVGERMCA